MPGVAGLQPARFALGLSAVFRTTPGLSSFWRNAFSVAVSGITECMSPAFGRMEREEDAAGTKIKSCGIGYALAANSCQGVSSVARAPHRLKLLFRLPRPM